MTQDELRALYDARLKRERQDYISKIVGISMFSLSKFRNNKRNLCPENFEKLKDYLTK